MNGADGSVLQAIVTPTKREQFLERLNKYRNNCQVIKQINSNKSRKYQRNHNVLNIFTILSSVVLTVFGFVDKKFIGTKILGYPQVDTSMVDFIFNLMVVSVLILSLINLIYRFQEKAFEHYRAVIILSGLVRDIDDMINFDSYSEAEIDFLLTELRNKYKSLLDLLPQNSDREFLNAKRDLVFKENTANAIEENREKKKFLWWEF